MLGQLHHLHSCRAGCAVFHSVFDDVRIILVDGNDGRFSLGSIATIVFLNRQRERLVAASHTLDGCRKGGCTARLHVELFAGYCHLIRIGATGCHQYVVTLCITQIADVEGDDLSVGGGYVIGGSLIAIIDVNGTRMSSIPIPVAFALVFLQQEAAGGGIVGQFPEIALRC